MLGGVDLKKNLKPVNLNKALKVLHFFFLSISFSREKAQISENFHE